MGEEYNYPKILENKYNKTINKNCGKDNLGNNLYFEGECPINYIEITNNPYPSLKNYKKYNWKNISIDNYYLFYINEYNEGEILIDLKISNNFRPCLNKKQNNEICTFYLEKCNLKEKYYVCDSYSKNTYKKIDNESIIELIEENNLNSKKDYDKTSLVYLYKETYIGFPINNNDTLTKAEKKSNEIFNIKQFIHKINIVLFIHMILFLIGIILFLIKKDLNNRQKLLKLILYIIYLILTLICFILLFILLIKHYIITKDIFEKFENELSNYYKHYLNWEIVLKILLLIFYIAIMIFIVIKLIDLIKWYYETYLIKENKNCSLNIINNETETKIIKDKESLKKELIELIDIENELKNKYDENEKIIKRERDEKIKSFEDLNNINSQIKQNYDNLYNEKKNINDKINNLKNEKNKYKELLIEIVNKENEIINLENDIIKEKEKKNNIKEIHDVYNREYIDILNERILHHK